MGQLRESTARSCDGDTLGSINTSSGSPCSSLGLHQAPVESALLKTWISNRANKPREALSPSALTFWSVGLWAPSHQTQFLCVFWMLQVFPEFLPNLSLSPGEAGLVLPQQCKMHHHTEQVLSIYPSCRKEIVEVVLPAACHWGGNTYQHQKIKIWFCLTAKRSIQNGRLEEKNMAKQGIFWKISQVLKTVWGLLFPQV